MYAKPAAPLWDTRNSLNVPFAGRLISLCWTLNPKNQIFISIVSMRSSQIEPVWSQATKITLTSLSCLAGRSGWCTGQEIKAHLCKPIFPTCQLPTCLGAGCGLETSIYSNDRSGNFSSYAPGVSYDVAGAGWYFSLFFIFLSRTALPGCFYNEIQIPEAISYP